MSAPPRIVDWVERSPRAGWDVRYTSVGARRPSDPWPFDADAETPNDAEADGTAWVQNIEALRSQVMVAIGNDQNDRPPSAAVRRWATTVRRILQRGRNPVISPELDAALGGDLGTARTIEDLAAALVGPHREVELDPSIDLDATWEQPFWDLLVGDHPRLARWVTPQVSLEGLFGDRAPGGDSRWVDFVVNPPWRSHPVVIEIDGSGHARSVAVDHERDRILKERDVATYRIPGPSVHDQKAPFRAAFIKMQGEHPSDRPHDAARYSAAPALVHRLAFGISLLVEAGHLEPGSASWDLTLTDELGVVENGIPWVLGFLRRVDIVVGDHIVPDQVSVNGVAWRFGPAGYETADAEVDPPSAHVILEAFTPAHAALPDATMPTVLIRPAFMPNQPAWWPDEVAPRWRLSDDAPPGVASAIEGLASDIYGYASLRPGQLEAILQVLRGRDSVVLLPTGSGKSLIYQLSALLLPGFCLIVDPIQALIDDQERRFLDIGIDRVLAIHSGRTRTVSARRESLQAVAHGDMLFALVTPERLQNKGFREALLQVATESNVNLAVVDEAHCVSEWGHDFRPAFLRLGASLRRFGSNRWDEPPPILALTGTASPRVLNDTLRALDIDRDAPGALQRPESFDRANLRYAIHAGPPRERTALLQRALRQTIPEVLGLPELDEGTSGIIFLPNVDGSKGLVDARDQILRPELLGGSISPDAIGFFAGRSPSRSTQGKKDKTPLFNQEEWPRIKRGFARAFIRGEMPLLAATKAFGMGIDKPDIRFTVHLGYPSSIEAFAQEAGRAGRDGATSSCVVIGLLPQDDIVEERTKNPNARPAKGRSHWREDDWGTQEYFLFNNYPGVDDEVAEVVALYREMRRLGAGGLSELELPERMRLSGETVLRTSYREATDSDGGGGLGVNRLLHRLSDVGVVDDIEYSSAGNLRVLFADFEEPRGPDTTPPIDAALLRFLRRNDPGRLRAHERRIADSPIDIDERVEHHVRVAVEAVYDVIFRARLNALEAMHRLVKDAPEDGGIRVRIASYLGNGPMADALDELTREGSTFDIPAALRRFKASPPSDDYEWRGAADRMLESFPRHPFVLAISTLGEFRLPSGEAERFSEALAKMLENLVETPSTTSERVSLLGWVLQQVRASPDPLRRSWLRDAWAAIGSSDLFAAEEFVTLEQVVLDKARTNDFVIEELEGLLTAQAERSRRNLHRNLKHLVQGGSHG